MLIATYIGLLQFCGNIWEQSAKLPRDHGTPIEIINLQLTFFCIVSGWCFGLAARHSICRSLSFEGASSPMSGAWTLLGQRMAPRFTISSNLFCYLVIIRRRSTRQQNMCCRRSLSKGTSSSMKFCFLGRKPDGSCDVKEAAMFHKRPAQFHWRVSSQSRLVLQYWYYLIPL
jgi:hypothetical protein